MRAVTCPRYGPPETLEIRDVPRPEPGPGEVLVRVRTSTVNRTDTATLRGVPFFARAMTGWRRPRHPVTGMDFAGEVERVGPGTERFAPGDRVFGFSESRFGAHAEFLCVSEDSPVAEIPSGVPTDEAVIGEGAWYASATTDRLEPDQSILIYGASGAIGTAAVQLAVARGAHVTAVVGTENVELAAALGAERVLDYREEDFTALGERFDLVFDAVGHTSFFACRKLLKPRGQYCATDLGPAWSNLWLPLVPGRRAGVPFPKDPVGLVRRLAKLLDEGRIRGVFDRRYPLSAVVEAFRFVESGRKTGIVRLDVATPAPAEGDDVRDAGE